MSRTFRNRPLGAWSDWPRRHLDLSCQSTCCSQKARRKAGDDMKPSDKKRALSY